MANSRPDQDVREKCHSCTCRSAVCRPDSPSQDGNIRCLMHQATYQTDVDGVVRFTNAAVKCKPATKNSIKMFFNLYNRKHEVAKRKPGWATRGTKIKSSFQELKSLNLCYVSRISELEKTCNRRSPCSNCRTKRMAAYFILIV
jgi:hypothetical protein